MGWSFTTENNTCSFAPASVTLTHRNGKSSLKLVVIKSYGGYIRHVVEKCARGVVGIISISAGDETDIIHRARAFASMRILWSLPTKYTYVVCFLGIP